MDKIDKVLEEWKQGNSFSIGSMQVIFDEFTKIKKGFYSPNNPSFYEKTPEGLELVCKPYCNILRQAIMVITRFPGCGEAKEFAKQGNIAIKSIIDTTFQQKYYELRNVLYEIERENRELKEQLENK